MSDYMTTCACGTRIYDSAFAPAECDECIVKRIEAETVAKVVAWLRVTPTACGRRLCLEASYDIDRIADAIERGEWKGKP